MSSDSGSIPTAFKDVFQMVEEKEQSTRSHREKQFYILAEDLGFVVFEVSQCTTRITTDLGPFPRAGGTMLGAITGSLIDQETERGLQSAPSQELYFRSRFLNPLLFSGIPTTREWGVSCTWRILRILPHHFGISPCQLQQQFMQQQFQTNSTQERTNQTAAQVIAKIEVQISQLAHSVGGREKGQFPSQTVPNPRTQPILPNPPRGQYEIRNNLAPTHDEVQAIHILRSGKQVDDKVGMPKQPDEKEGPKEKETIPMTIEKGKEKKNQDQNQSINLHIPKAS
ncbi:hypothetical protein HHK36_017105 [Tetracentron sinense]|uniref:Uncharacterized protein n=1 Tax=Tetracentron sinense TaxID=13715 RepID=A0A835DFB4_TETSI|nr:hypothetical protein HHK36_017105 [Tetracentron sinense]